MDPLTLFTDDIKAIVSHLNVTRKHINIIVDYEPQLHNPVTPLMNAVIRERNDVVDILIEYGCNIDYQDQYGYTALHYCVMKRWVNRDVLQKLLNANANPSIPDYFGNIPLHYAASYANDVNIIHLLTYGSNHNLQNEDGNTPLINACNINSSNINVSAALINLTDVNISNNYGNTALHEVSFFDDYVILKLLIEAGADINITNNDDRTAYDIVDDEGKRIIDEYFKREEPARFEKI